MEHKKNSIRLAITELKMGIITELKKIFSVHKALYT